jgi:hypothetical protein
LLEFSKNNLSHNGPHRARPVAFLQPDAIAIAGFHAQGPYASHPATAHSNICTHSVALAEHLHNLLSRNAESKTRTPPRFVLYFTVHAFDGKIVYEK